jgi:hypothetical protein
MIDNKKTNVSWEFGKFSDTSHELSGSKLYTSDSLDRIEGTTGNWIVKLFKGYQLSIVDFRVWTVRKFESQSTIPVGASLPHQMSRDEIKAYSQSAFTNDLMILCEPPLQSSSNASLQPERPVRTLLARDSPKEDHQLIDFHQHPDIRIARE